MTCIRFTIHGEPASKSNSRKIVKLGTRTAIIKSNKALAYESYARQQIPDHCLLMLDGPIKFIARIFYASNRPDLDESVILDVLQARYKMIDGKRVLVRMGVYINDRAVHEKHIYWGLDRNDPRAEIEIEPLQIPLLRGVDRHRVSKEEPI